MTDERDPREPDKGELTPGDPLGADAPGGGPPADAPDGAPAADAQADDPTGDPPGSPPQEETAGGPEAAGPSPEGTAQDPTEPAPSEPADTAPTEPLAPEKPAGTAPTEELPGTGAPPPPPPPPPPPAAGPQPLVRPTQDRVIAGVCAAVARRVGIDATWIRVAAVALIFAGGLGLFLYIAGVLLIPQEGSSGERSRLGTVIGVLALVVGAIVLLPGAGLAFGLLTPLIVLGGIGLLLYLIVARDPQLDRPGKIGRAALLGFGLLILCGILGFGAFVAAIAGGGAVVAGLVIAGGLALVAGAFSGGLRWLIPPALTLALAGGVAAAADIDGGGGIGERNYRPGSVADIRDRYEIGAGQIVLDLRNVAFPAGDRHVHLEVGMGEAVVYVPENVCVASKADVGMGNVKIFGRDNGGIDVDWEDPRRAPAGTARLLVDADIGFGELSIRHRGGRDRHFGDRGFFDDERFDEAFDETANRACIGGA